MKFVEKKNKAKRHKAFEILCDPGSRSLGEYRVIFCVVYQSMIWIDF